MRIKPAYYIIALMAVALYLRIDSADKPLWIDEAKCALESPADNGGRDLLLKSIWWVYDPESELSLRMPVIIASTLTVAAFYYVFGVSALPFMILIAIHPYFVFWGSLARPYALAALFCVLGIKYRWLYVLAILTNPFAITGLYWLKRDRIAFNIGIIIAAVMWFAAMPLSDNNYFRLEFLYEAKRLWYLPLVNLFAHLVGLEQELPGIRDRLQRLV